MLLDDLVGALASLRNSAQDREDGGGPTGRLDELRMIDALAVVEWMLSEDCQKVRSAARAA